MKFNRTLFTGTALALLLASPALADLTADQVLADQLKQMEAYGLKAEVAGRSRSGDTLSVDGLTADIEVPEGALAVTIGGATFRELGDGTVEITYPATIPVTLSGTAADGEDFGLTFALTQSGTRTVASGIPEEIRYEFASDKMTLGDFRFTAPEDAAALDMEMAVTLTGLSGVMDIIGGGTIRDYKANFAFEGISGVVSGRPEGEQEGAFRVEFQGTDIESDYEGRMAPQEVMGSFAQAIQAGTRTAGSMTHGPVTYTVSGEGPEGTFETATAVASGRLDFRMDESGLDYGGTSTDMTTTIGGSVIPLPPLTFRMAEAGGRIAMPVVPSEDAQTFALSINLAGLEVDQMLWGMIDPVGQIPRDPANLVIDLGGEVVMEQDIFDPDFAEQMDGAPGQINALTINRVLLNIAGAELTGDGDFAFDNEGPMPVPSGTVNLMLTGANTLLDTLVGMGLVPEDQAMGVRMMSSMFARPGDGPDTLVSTIEVKEDGSVLANGQRIK
jgi:hypothetical protein